MTMPGIPREDALPAITPRTSGVHHVALRSADLARSREFYVAALGLPLLMESHDQFVVLAGQTSVGVHGGAAGTDPPDAPRTGLHHLSLGCDSDAELARIAEALAARGVESTGVRTDELFDRRYVSFHDPDGIRWEVYVT
jgi:glyoxylase I family protein